MFSAPGKLPDQSSSSFTQPAMHLPGRNPLLLGTLSGAAPSWIYKKSLDYEG
jgi:hypothetical protein